MKITLNDAKKLITNYYYLKLNNLCSELTYYVDKVIQESDYTTKNIIYSKYFKKESRTKYSMDNFVSLSLISRKVTLFRNKVFFELHKIILTPEMKTALVKLRKL